MKRNAVCWSLLLALLFCGTTVFQTHIYAQSDLSGSIALKSGEEVTGSLPAAIVNNDCVLGATQYKIEIVGGDKKLRVVLGGGLDVDLYIRRNTPIAIEDGKIVSDFKSTSSGPTEVISLPAFFGEAPLQPGSYFIAITNCATTAENYRLTATITDPPDVAILDISSILFGLVVGSIPTPVPGNCGISRTQYRLIDVVGPCDFVALAVTIHADQNVNVVIRKDKPVAVENGVLMYDDMSENQVKVHNLRTFQKTPGVGTFFIAVLNCGFEPVNYTLSAGQSHGDPNPFFISEVSLKKKKLHVIGPGIRRATVSIDGQPQKTIDGGHNERFFDILIVKNAKKKIPRNQTVIITATRSDLCFPNSSNFAFTRH